MICALLLLSTGENCSAQARPNAAFDGMGGKSKTTLVVATLITARVSSALPSSLSCAKGTR